MHESTNSRSAREFKSFHDQPMSDLKYAFVKTGYLENLKEKEMCQGNIKNLWANDELEQNTSNRNNPPSFTQWFPRMKVPLALVWKDLTFKVTIKKIIFIFDYFFWYFFHHLPLLIILLFTNTVGDY